MGLQKGLLLFVGAVLVTIGFAFFTPWPAYALAPAIHAPFSIMVIVGTGILSELFPEGRRRATAQKVAVLLAGVIAGSLVLLTLYKGT